MKKYMEEHWWPWIIFTAVTTLVAHKNWERFSRGLRSFETRAMSAGEELSTGLGCHPERV